MNPKRKMVGMVLAAGHGSRLTPLTEHLPKPAVPFFHKPLLCYALDTLFDAGIRHIGINAFHCPETIIELASRWEGSHQAEEVTVTVSVEDSLLGTGGGVRHLWEKIGSPDCPAVILNGDVVWSLKLHQIMNAFERSPLPVGLVVASEGEGRVFVDSTKERIVGLPHDPNPIRLRPSDRAFEVSYTGAAIINADVIRALPQAPGCLIRAGIAPRLAQGAQIGALWSTGGQIDVGTPERYWRAICDALDERHQLIVPSTAPSTEGTRFHQPVWLAEGVELSSDATIGPYVVLGKGVRVGRKARLSYLAAYDTDLEGECHHRLQVGTDELMSQVRLPSLRDG